MENRRTLEECGGVSLIHPYYKDTRRLELQFDVWKKWSYRVCANVAITLIDDGSPMPLTLTTEQKNILRDKDIHLSIFRILKDIRYNTPGALNLGVTVAPKAWVLFMDTDCFFESDMWDKILDTRHDDFVISKFDRKRYGTTEPPSVLNNHRYLPCTMLMHKQVFWNVGGFDEDFNYNGTGGGYGLFDTFFDVCSSRKGHWSDWEYLDEANGIKNEGHHVDHNIIAGEWMPSICGDTNAPRGDGGVLERRMNKLGKVLYNSKRRGEVPRNHQILNFPWMKVYDSKYEILNLEILK
jgi:hypothetical protein